MGIYIKGLDMPKEGECDIIAIHGNGEVCRWFAERNNEPIAEAEELGKSEEREEDEIPRRIRTNGMVILEQMERMDVPWRCTMMNELEQKVEISIDAEWWVAEYKEEE